MNDSENQRLADILERFIGRNLDDHGYVAFKDGDLILDGQVPVTHDDVALVQRVMNKYREPTPAQDPLDEALARVLREDCATALDDTDVRNVVDAVMPFIRGRFTVQHPPETLACPTLRPLGITDVYETKAVVTANHWYWCRAEHENGTPHGVENVSEPAYDVCIRIGPFMSEREANRLGGYNSLRADAAKARAALGTEME